MAERKLFPRCRPRSWLALLALPLAYLSFHGILFRTVDDARFETRIDPDYAYLVSAIDLGRLPRSRMVVHPGTPVQVIGHLVMRGVHALHGSPENFIDHVLRHPAQYLNWLSHAFALFSALAVFLAGALLLGAGIGLWNAVLAQSAPLLCTPLLLFGFRGVTSDILLVAVSLLFGALVYRVIATGAVPEKGRKATTWIVTLGVVAGLGLATKVTFAVMLLLPLMLLPGWRRRSAFLLVTGVSALLFTVPIWSQFPRLLRFLGRIASHQALYGNGPQTLFDSGRYADSLGRLLLENIPFITLTIVAVLQLGRGCLFRAWRARFPEPAWRLLQALVAVNAVSILLVARHFKSKYLIPPMCLTGLLLVILSSAMRRDATAGERQQRRLRLTPLFLAISLLFTMAGIHAAVKGDLEKLGERNRAEALLKQEHADACVVRYYCERHSLFGLYFGSRWTPGYAPRLARLYGPELFYDHLTHVIRGWERTDVVPLAELLGRCAGGIILVGSPFLFQKNMKTPPPFRVRTILPGRYVSLYQVVSMPDLPK